MTTVQCAQCKAPFAVYGVEPPLEYVCGGCTQASETPDPTQPCDFCGARVLGDGEVLGDGNLMCYRCMHPSARPLGYVLPPVADEMAEGLGGPPVLSPLEERVAALERELRAGITRAENDLAEARTVARRLYECTGLIHGWDYAQELLPAHPWLIEGP